MSHPLPPGRFGIPPLAVLARRLRGGFRVMLVLSTLLVAAVATALTPPLDDRTAVFAGIWQGGGRLGSFCLLKLDTDGSGMVLVEPGNGQWMGAALTWANDRQSVAVQTVRPLPLDAARVHSVIKTVNPQLTPIPALTLTTQANNYLILQWGPKAEDSCHLAQEAALLRKRQDAAELLNAARPGGSVSLPNTPSRKPLP